MIEKAINIYIFLTKFKKIYKTIRVFVLRKFTNTKIFFLIVKNCLTLTNINCNILFIVQHFFPKFFKDILYHEGAL